MSQSDQIQFTESERDILLRGLRFVRSSVMFAQEDPVPTELERRQEQIEKIERLATRLSSVSAVEPVNS